MSYFLCLISYIYNSRKTEDGSLKSVASLVQGCL